MHTIVKNENQLVGIILGVQGVHILKYNCSNPTIFRALSHNLARTSSITRSKLRTQKTKQLSYPPSSAPCILSYASPSSARTDFCCQPLALFSLSRLESLQRDCCHPKCARCTFFMWLLDDRSLCTSPTFSLAFHAI